MLRNEQDVHACPHPPADGSAALDPAAAPTPAVKTAAIEANDRRKYAEAGIEGEGRDTAERQEQARGQHCRRSNLVGLAKSIVVAHRRRSPNARPAVARKSPDEAGYAYSEHGKRQQQEDDADDDHDKKNTARRVAAANGLSERGLPRP